MPAGSWNALSSSYGSCSASPPKAGRTAAQVFLDNLQRPLQIIPMPDPATPHGPRYWTLAAALASAQSRAERDARPYHVFSNDAEGCWSVSMHSEPTEGSRLVQTCSPSHAIVVVPIVLDDEAAFRLSGPEADLRSLIGYLPSQLDHDMPRRRSATSCLIWYGRVGACRQDVLDGLRRASDLAEIDLCILAPSAVMEAIATDEPSACAGSR